MDLDVAGNHRRMQLSELEEWREKAYHNSKIYKERVKRWQDKIIMKKEFTPGDKVLLFNSRVKLFGHGKLWSKWEGPFKVINSSSHGAITLQNDEGTLFKKTSMGEIPRHANTLRLHHSMIQVHTLHTLHIHISWIMQNTFSDMIK